MRADAGTRLGTGHVMRCSALAEVWLHEGGSAHMLLGARVPPIEERLSAHGVTVHHLECPPGGEGDAEATASLAGELGAQWAVVDGYHFDTGYQRRVQDAGLRVLAIDDYGHAGHYCADVVLNQNVYANEGIYDKREADTRLLLGPHYALLRREFWRWMEWRRDTPPIASKILVTLGGSDPDNVTCTVAEAFREPGMGDTEIMAVVGASNPHHAELRAISEASTSQIQLQRDVTNMSELMAWADLAVIAGGTSCLEAAFMGLPALVLVLADNQRPVAEAIEANGAGQNLGWYSDVSAQDIGSAIRQLAQNHGGRDAMARTGRELVDGLGAVRVLKELGLLNLRLREATADDRELVWDWANEPVVRAASFRSDPIQWEEHVNWFGAAMDNPNCVFWIVMLGCWPVGQIRFEIDGDGAVVSVSLGERFRGRGYGSEIIASATQRLRDDRATRHVRAYIKAQNNSSATAFEKAGYRLRDEVVMSGVPALEYVASREE